MATRYNCRFEFLAAINIFNVVPYVLQKVTYKNEVEKLIVQVEEHQREKKEKEVVVQKYELAKKKLSEALSSLKQAETTNQHYSKQVRGNKREKMNETWKEKEGLTGREMGWKQRVP